MFSDLSFRFPRRTYWFVPVTDSGIIIKIPLSQISILKRNTQGTRLINLKDDQKVSTVAVVSNDLDDDNEENEVVK